MEFNINKQQQKKSVALQNSTKCHKMILKLLWQVG